MVIVDTDILIDAGRGVPDAVTRLEHEEQHDMLGISIITQMELIVGCRNRAELTALEKFLNRFNQIPLSEPISRIALDLIRQYRLSHGLLIADALIAATAIARSCPFITKNQRHYRIIPELSLLPYPDRHE